MEQLDFVAVGDITTDAFIELQDVHEHKNHGDSELCMRFGDKIEYKNVVEVRAVGNSPNAAVSAHRLGLTAGLVTHVGDDRNGNDNIEQLKKEGVSTDYVTVQKGRLTNYHYVLRFGAERTILIKHYEYDYKLPTFATPPKWLYFSSVGENSMPYHHEIAAYVKKNPETKLAFQPGTFQINLGAEILKDVYEATEIFFCNKEEAQKILKDKEDNIEKLLDSMRALGPNIVIITDGPRGAHASDGSGVYTMPMYPDPAPPVDRTGAGDAFSSTVTAMLARGMTLPEALQRGPINSMNVVQHIGAQKGLLKQDEIETLLMNAPEKYKLS